jgi:hypothetical protein
MPEKRKALGLIVILAVAILIGHFWAFQALLILVHVSLVLMIEIALSYVRIGPDGPTANK